jgi:hypothetical protein
VYFWLKLVGRLLKPKANYCNYTRNNWNSVYDVVWTHIFTENTADPDKQLTLSPNLENNKRA